jgi:hypothetical protein
MTWDIWIRKYFLHKLQVKVSPAVLQCWIIFSKGVCELKLSEQTPRYEGVLRGLHFEIDCFDERWMELRIV